MERSSAPRETARASLVQGDMRSSSPPGGHEELLHWGGYGEFLHLWGDTGSSSTLGGQEKLLRSRGGHPAVGPQHAHGCGRRLRSFPPPSCVARPACYSWHLAPGNPVPIPAVLGKRSWHPTMAARPPACAPRSLLVTRVRNAGLIKTV